MKIQAKFVERYATVRIWTKTRNAARILAAMRGQTMVETLEDVVSLALEREKVSKAVQDTITHD